MNKYVLIATMFGVVLSSSVAESYAPTTLIAKNLMQAHRWGLKTFYYSLINKQGSKGQDEPVEGKLEAIDFDDQEDCEACKL